MNLPHSSQVHFWFTRLDEDLYSKQSLALLNSEEIKRAEKFKFPLHRQRFITARAALRSILSLYLNINPINVRILYQSQGKPYIEESGLQFNLSHSQNRAVYVIAHEIKLGIDIEKIKKNYNPDVAQRFFSPEEYNFLTTLPAAQQVKDFYRIWAGKEALIKGLGQGIAAFSLSSFTLPAGGEKQIVLTSNSLQEKWYLENLNMFDDYHIALASNKLITHFSYWEWTESGGKKWREDEIRGNLP